MGQQQLLLLVLGIVIVGLAVVVGIQAFGENQKKANADALVNDGVRIASDVQAWRLKPAAFGGGADATLGDVKFNDIGYETGTNGAGTGEYGNLNGVFTLTGTAANDCVLIHGSNTAQSNDIYVKVTGTGTDQIETAVNPATALACSS